MHAAMVRFDWELVDAFRVVVVGDGRVDLITTSMRNNFMILDSQPVEFAIPFGAQFNGTSQMREALR